MNLNPVESVIAGVERGLLPDSWVRAGIRRLLKQRLLEIADDDAARAAGMSANFVEQLRTAPVALLPEKANEQHYELPAEFFGAVLGPHRKYSSCYWPEGIDNIEAAEAAALKLTCEHANLQDGQFILELGCGWGSLSLWMAQQYPNAQIISISNSHSQRRYIETTAQMRKLHNLRVITCDMNQFDIDLRFDRIVSVEMFEHMRNWPELFQRVHGWLNPGGKFFMHVFVHRTTPYAFEERDASDWMSRYFFSGGMMPSDDLALLFQDHLRFVQRWRWDGHHYERTLNTWLAKMDAARSTLWPLFEKTYGVDQASIWWMRWRIFFMSCAELFGYGDAQRWWVSHYLFERRP